MIFKMSVPRPTNGSRDESYARSLVSGPLLTPTAGKVATRHTFRGQGLTVAGTVTAPAFPAARWGRFTWI